MEENQFIVSVDDGFCEWSYTIDVGDKSMSIHKIVACLCGGLGIQIPTPVQRRKFEVANV